MDSVLSNEKGFVMTHALRSCRRKVFKKGFANDKLSNDEKDQFIFCLAKYFETSHVSNEGLRAGLLHGLE